MWGELVQIMCRPPFVHQVMRLPWASTGINQQPRGSCNLRGIAPGLYLTRTSLVAQMVKASAYNARGPGSIPGMVRYPGEGNGNPLQYSCLENPMDRGGW